MPDSSGKWTSQDAIEAIITWSKKYGYSDSFIQFALSVAYGESGMNPYAVGDNGQSHGIFQFYQGGGRGTGIDAATLQNPWFQAEKNLGYLNAAYQQYGGDSGWATNPAVVLRSGWKYGQGSIWPQDHQLSSALGSMKNLLATQPGLLDSQFSSPITTDTNPPDPTQTAYQMPQFTQFDQSMGMPYQPSFAFLSNLMYGDGGSMGQEPPVNGFLASLMGGSGQSGNTEDPSSAFLSSLYGRL